MHVLVVFLAVVLFQELFQAVALFHLALAAVENVLALVAEAL